MLLYLRQKYANVAVPPTQLIRDYLIGSPPNLTGRLQHQMALHLHHLQPTCPNPALMMPTISTISTATCGAQQLVACGFQAANVVEDTSSGPWRPSKKLRLIQKRREAELYGVEARLEDAGVGPDGERRRKRAVVNKKKKESLDQKLKRKFCSRRSRSLKPWDRAAMSEIYPSSSEDETCGWIAPGDYLRSLFDLPDGFVAETREESKDEEAAEDKKADNGPR